MHDCNKKMTLKNNRIITLLRISSLVTVFYQFLLFRIKEKLKALLVHTSFKGVANRGFRRAPYSVAVVLLGVEVRSGTVVVLLPPQHCGIV